MTPSQEATYLGIKLDTVAGLARPSDKRLTKWISITKEFIDKESPPAIQWLQLPGHQVSLEKLVPYGRVRIRPNQWQLKLHWYQRNQSPFKQVLIDNQTGQAILWWTNMDNLTVGVPLGMVQVNNYLFTDSSPKGWGAHMQELTASGIWTEQLSTLHINVLELKATKVFDLDYKPSATNWTTVLLLSCPTTHPLLPT